MLYGFELCLSDLFEEGFEFGGVEVVRLATSDAVEFTCTDFVVGILVLADDPAFAVLCALNCLYTAIVDELKIFFARGCSARVVARLLN